MSQIATTGLLYLRPLDFLPRKRVQDLAKGRLIYGVEKPSSDLYMVILGRVKVSTTAGDGCQTVSRMVRTEGLFGQPCLVGQTDRGESATALDNVTLMSWSRGEVELQIEREPKLGIALSQYMVRECLELKDRIESMATRKTPERVMLALLQLADDLGTPMSDGATRVASLTHQTIAEFVGTSREVVTLQMNRLRRLGLCRYSRKFIDLYSPTLREHLIRHLVGIQMAQKTSRDRTELEAKVPEENQTRNTAQR